MVRDLLLQQREERSVGPSSNPRSGRNRRPSPRKGKASPRGRGCSVMSVSHSSSGGRRSPTPSCHHGPAVPVRFRPRFFGNTEQTQWSLHRPGTLFSAAARPLSGSSSAASPRRLTIGFSGLADLPVGPFRCVPPGQTSRAGFRGETLSPRAALECSRRNRRCLC